MIICVIVVVGMATTTTHRGISMVGLNLKIDGWCTGNNFLMMISGRIRYQEGKGSILERIGTLDLGLCWFDVRPKKNNQSYKKHHVR